MKSILNQSLILVISFYFLGCTEGVSLKKVMDLPVRGATGINAVIEIPAGSNQKIEYQKESQKFANDQLDGQDRVVQFLPYPGNYGFIPSTYMDPAEGGDGDALDILVLSESQATGSVMEVKIIATLLLRDNGEIDTKIIAIPVDPALQTIKVEDFQDFLINQDAVRGILQEWFLNYKGANQMELIRWEDEQYAMQEINQWTIK